MVQPLLGIRLVAYPLEKRLLGDRIDHVRVGL